MAVLRLLIQFLKNGEENIINLFIDKDWMFEYKSLIAQKSSDSFIQAMEDSEVFVLEFLLGMCNDLREIV